MTTLAERLAEALAEIPNARQSDLARACGISTPSVNGWFTGKTQTLKDTSLVRAAEFLRVNPEWLATGKGTKTKLFVENVSHSQIGSRKIPVISSIQAGYWREIVDSYQLGEGDSWLLTDVEVSDMAFALEVVGNSMLPRFRPGDKIIVDPNRKPKPGEFVVARNGEAEATFKKYRPRGMSVTGELIFELVPLNPDYPTLSSDITPMEIIGTVVEHRNNTLL